MTESAKHDIALSAAKIFIDSNMPEYINSEDGYYLLVSDYLSRYLQALKQIDKELPLKR